MSAAFRRRSLPSLAAALWLVISAVRADGGDLRVMSARALATAPGAVTAAVYVTVHNVGGVADRLLGASTPAAQGVELHSMTLDGGTMRMRPLPGVDLPVGGSIEMGPLGAHLMLTGLRRPLLAGQRFRMQLRFARAGELPVEVVVAPLGGG